MNINPKTLEEELDMGHLKESIHHFVEQHIIADDPSPERSWLDNLSGELEPPVEEVPETT